MQGWYVSTDHGHFELFDGGKRFHNGTLHESWPARLRNVKVSPMNGPLKNGNPRGDPGKAPRCGAKNRRGEPCRCPAMRGKRRCRLHGGLSTGAKTKAGIHRIRLASWKHGRRSARLIAERRAKRQAERERFGLGPPMTLKFLLKHY